VPPKRLGDDALERLRGHAFPGNVRELENLIERAFALGARGQLTLSDLPTLTPSRAPSLPPSSELPTLGQVERELILRALEVYRNDREKAARAIGISRRTIYRRLKDYGLL